MVLKLVRWITVTGCIKYSLTPYLGSVCGFSRAYSVSSICFVSSTCFVSNPDRVLDSSDVESSDVNLKVTKFGEFVMSPLHFVVRYNDKFYTNVSFTNEIRYIMFRVSVGLYKFIFYMCTNRGSYKQVLSKNVYISIYTKKNALDLSSQLAGAVFCKACIDRTQPVKVTVVSICTDVE